MAELMHMESEAVRDVGQMLGRLSDEIVDARDEISQKAAGMDWTGPRRDEFVQKLQGWALLISLQGHRCRNQGKAVANEAEEWETAADEFGWGEEGYTPFLVGQDDGLAAAQNDVLQGPNMGDCYLMASLAAIVKQHPEFIEKMITVNPDGTCTVRFYDPITLKPVDITVDMDFPRNGAGGYPYANPTDISEGGTEAWTMIIERAYIKWKGGPEKMDQFFPLPLTEITGKRGTTFPPALMSINDFNKALNNGDAIIVYSWPGDINVPGTDITIIDPDKMAPYQDGRVSRQHAYYVTAVDPEKNMITLGNPWGYDLPPVEMSFSEFQECFSFTCINPVE